MVASRHDHDTGRALAQINAAAMPATAKVTAATPAAADSCTALLGAGAGAVAGAEAGLELGVLPPVAPPGAAAAVAGHAAYVQDTWSCIKASVGCSQFLCADVRCSTQPPQ